MLLADGSLILAHLSLRFGLGLQGLHWARQDQGRLPLLEVRAHHWDPPDQQGRPDQPDPQIRPLPESQRDPLHLGCLGGLAVQQGLENHDMQCNVFVVVI